MRGSRYRGERISGALSRDGARLTVTGEWGISHPHILPAGGWAPDLSERRFAIDQRSASLARHARDAVTNIGRRVGGVPISTARAVNGGQGSSPSPGLAAGARGRPGPGPRPSFARLAVSPSGVASEPQHGSRTLLAPARRRRGILVADSTIPMNQTALTVGTVPARRPGRLVAHRYAALTLTGGTCRHASPRTARHAQPGRVAVFSCQSPSAAHLPASRRFCSRPIRLASMATLRGVASSVGAQIRPQRTLPRNIAIAWDGSVAHPGAAALEAAFPACAVAQIRRVTSSSHQATTRKVAK
jgi:hypothetical protein